MREDDRNLLAVLVLIAVLGASLAINTMYLVETRTWTLKLESEVRVLQRDVTRQEQLLRVLIEQSMK